MKHIDKLKELKHLKIPHFHLDGFQQNILENIHLEFFLDKSRVILTPDFQFYLTGETIDKEIIEVEQFLKEKDLIKKIKDFIIYNLAFYSALIETNSYYIENNQNLIICRFVPELDHKDHFELKVYTIHPDELPDNYKDKIYLGRDFVCINSLTRKYLGILSINNSLNEQIKKLEKRLNEYIPKEIFSEIQSEYLDEIKELLGEVFEYTENIKNNFPEEISKKQLNEKQLIEVNKIFRNIKHILMDIDETTKELEEKLFQLNLLKASKYVIKFKKDIINYIHYILIKINGRISDSVNHIHI
ncbi:MAG: hypothetical protein KatS3mg129_0749 [Leptospiraceae bacterium]|nr:MAG: hypothetical protein KatS3mg129_0749 [Leptospiraceae bacterium]